MKFNFFELIVLCCEIENYIKKVINLKSKLLSNSTT